MVVTRQLGSFPARRQKAATYGTCSVRDGETNMPLPLSLVPESCARALSRTCPFGEPQRPARVGVAALQSAKFLRYMGLRRSYGSLRLRRSHLPGGAVALSPAKTRDYGTRRGARAATSRRSAPSPVSCLRLWPDVARTGRPKVQADTVDQHGLALASQAAQASLLTLSKSRWLARRSEGRSKPSASRPV